MICYHDRAWCATSYPDNGHPRCVNTECSRCITDEDAARAQALDLPFSLAPFRMSDCGYRSIETMPVKDDK